MGVICKYKYDSSIYADFIPEFNSGYSGYTITDEVEGNIITRTIESDSLPTLMKFGTKWSGTDNSTNREKSLLSVFDINMQELNTGYCMFYRCSNLTDVTSSIISAKMKTIANMFQHCTKIKSIDIILDTSNVTNMNNMFSGCNNLASLDVSNWNTSNVTDMNNMFRNCNNLTSLDVSNFDTSKVENMQGMFYGCNNLTSLDVSNFDTVNVTTMVNMFKNCSKLTSLNVSGFNTANVTTMAGMFYGCNNLTSLDVSNWITSNLTSITTMFAATNNLYEIKGINNWDTSKISSVNGCFASCYKIKELDLSNWKLSANITNYEGIFTSCHNLRVLNISNFHIPSNANINSFVSNSIEHVILLNSDIDTINILGSYGGCQNATIYVDESLDQSQYTGTAPLKVYKEEKLEIKLNSPLLEGDTIEVVDGKLCHVHRWNKVVLNGGEDDYNIWGPEPAENHSAFILKFTREKICKGIYTTIAGTDNHYYLGDYICDNFAKGNMGTAGYHMTFYNNFHFSLPTNQLNENTVEGFKQWLSENPTTLVYPLATPYYEDITPLQSSIILKTFLESSMTVDTILPIETKLSYRTNVPSISTLSTRATELAESDNVIHNLMNIIDDEVDE